MTPRTKTFDGAHAKRLRKRLKIRAADIAEACGVTKQTVYNWEAEKGAPDFVSGRTIARMLKVRPSMLERPILEKP